MKTKQIILGVFAMTMAVTLQLQAQVFLTGGLVAYYPFSGNANDQSGLGNNPVTNTASLTYDRFSRTNAAYAFNGAQDIQYINAAQLDTLTNFTVTCWIKTTNSPGSFVGLVSKGNTIPVVWTGFEVGQSGNNVQIQINHTTYTGAVAINDGNWHAVSVVFDNNAGQISLYVDGQLDSQFADPVNAVTVTNPLYLGTDRQTGAFFTGSLDEVRVYNRALGTNETTQLFTVEDADYSLPFVPISFSVTLEKQSATTVAGNISTTAKPQKVSIKTIDILKALALDENMQGSWASNSFPSKAVLALAGHSLVVLNGTNVLMNVSDVLHYTASKNLVFSGAQDNTTGLAATKMIILKEATITFDDLFVGGGSTLKFYLTGQLSVTVTDTAPVAGAYTETRAFKLSSGTGDGWIGGTSFVASGTVSGTSSKTLLHL